MSIDAAPGRVFRPPNEADSLILRVTLGCSHNACRFCTMYKGTVFTVRPREEISGLIKEYARLYPLTRRIFLGDGDALTLPTDMLLSILKELHQAFPHLTRCSAYATPGDILKKSEAELISLQKHGLQTLYMGMESGSDEVLTLMHKGVKARHIIEAGQKINRTGMKLSVMIILGLGGKELSQNHIDGTIKTLEQFNISRLSALTLMIPPDSELMTLIKDGLFTPNSAEANANELYQLISQYSPQKPVIFRSDHPSNQIMLAGVLPKDREKLLAQLYTKNQLL